LVPIGKKTKEKKKKNENGDEKTSESNGQRKGYCLERKFGRVRKLVGAFEFEETVPRIAI